MPTPRMVLLGTIGTFWRAEYCIFSLGLELLALILSKRKLLQVSVILHTWIVYIFLKFLNMTIRQLVGLFLNSLPLPFDKTHVYFPRCVPAHGWIHKRKRKCINYCWSRFKLSKENKPVLANFLASTVQYSHPVNCCEYCRPFKDGDDTFDPRLSAYAPTVLPRADLCTSVYCALY
jgi:hypothetical protein